MSPAPDNSTDLLTAIELMCHTAGGVLMHHFRDLDEYEKKGAIDLVTIADKESEAAIISAIRARYPQHAILAEESGASGEREAEYRWVIDPLDGTTNFTHGMANFSISIGVQHRGVTIAAGVYAPALGELFLASREQGATRNGRPIHVSRVETLEEALLDTGFPYNRRDVLDWICGTLGDFLARSQGMLRLGSAALDLCYVGAGFVDGFYEVNLHPWDMCAGALIVEEAGGRITEFDGAPFTIDSRRVLATNGNLHEEMMAVLRHRPFAEKMLRK